MGTLKRNKKPKEDPDKTIDFKKIGAPDSCTCERKLGDGGSWRIIRGSSDCPVHNEKMTLFTKKEESE